MMSMREVWNLSMVLVLLGGVGWQTNRLYDSYQLQQQYSAALDTRYALFEKDLSLSSKVLFKNIEQYERDTALLQKLEKEVKLKPPGTLENLVNRLKNLFD